MSEHGPNPDQEAELAKAKEIKQATEAHKKITETQNRLHGEYLVYADRRAEVKGENLFSKPEFLEFLNNVNPNYLNFFNNLLENNLKQANPDNKKSFDDEEIKEIFAEYERKLEFLRTNYSVGLSDQEAVQALVFLNEQQNPTPEIAQEKVKAWRNLAKQWKYKEKNEKGEDTPIIHLSRAGFNIKEIAPNIKDQGEEKLKKDGLLCYENFKYLQDWNFPDNPTQDEIRFFIPRLIPSSTNLNYQEQTNLINEISQNLQTKNPQWNISLSMGEANQVANQILAHYNNTGERIPSKLDYARTLTRYADGDRLGLGNFDAKGLYYNRWSGEYHDGGIGVSALGVEKILN